MVRAILALDPAKQMGFCSAKKSGTVFLGSEKPDRLKFLFDFLNDIIEEEKITHIAYEKPGGSHYNALVSHANLEGVILLLCAMHSLQYYGYSATSIKKYITDNGAAKKADVIAAVKELGYDPADDNEADAIALYRLADSELK